MQKAKGSAASNVSNSNIDFQSLNNPGLDFNTLSGVSSDLEMSVADPDELEYPESDQSRESASLDPDIIKIKEEPMDFYLERERNCQHSDPHRLDNGSPVPQPAVEKEAKAIYESTKKIIDEINLALIKAGSVSYTGFLLLFRSVCLRTCSRVMHNNILFCTIDKRQSHWIFQSIVEYTCFYPSHFYVRSVLIQEISEAYTLHNNYCNCY